MTVRLGQELEPVRRDLVMVMVQKEVRHSA